jgi:hypothetical protein
MSSIPIASVVFRPRTIFAFFPAIAKVNSNFADLADSLAVFGTSVALAATSIAWSATSVAWSAASTAEFDASVAGWTASIVLDLLAAHRESTLLIK